MNGKTLTTRRSGAFWSRVLLVLFAAAVVTGVSGCMTEEKLPAEDLEVHQFYGDLIRVLQDPKLPPNSREKYEAAKELVSKVDFTLARELNTLNSIFYHGDALIDTPDQPDRTIIFYYPYDQHYVRLTFYTYQTWVLRVKVDQK